MLSAENRQILRWNLLILLGGAVLAGLLAGLSGGEGLMLFAFQIGLQALLNLVLALAHSFSARGDGTAAGYWLSLLLVLIIGPGSCGFLGMMAFG